MAKKGKKNGKAEADDAPPETIIEQPAAIIESPAASDGGEPSTIGESVVADAHLTKKGKLKEEYYEAEMLKLQEELVKLQYWVKEKGLRVVIIFEGRDAAGKGGVIKRIVERTNPRILRVVALGIPSDVEKTQWYFQRWVANLPAGGEIVLFDRSWYTRAITCLLYTSRCV